MASALHLVACGRHRKSPCLTARVAREKSRALAHKGRCSMRSTVAISLALCLLVPRPAHADEITDQIDQAKTYYGQGDVPGAIAELEFALQALRGKIGQELLGTFPPAPAGWSVGALWSRAARSFSTNCAALTT